MKNIVIILVLSLFGSNKNIQTPPPVGGGFSQKDLRDSKVRSKNLNQIEREQIQGWILDQNIKYYPTSLNYWTNIEGFDKRPRKANETLVSYEYDLYDFDQTKIYDKPQGKQEVRLGHFNELKAVEDALRFANRNEEVTLLVPSALAYGTYGDEKKIGNDIPLIIKLKVF